MALGEVGSCFFGKSHSEINRPLCTSLFVIALFVDNQTTKNVSQICTFCNCCVAILHVQDGYLNEMTVHYCQIQIH